MLANKRDTVPRRAAIHLLANPPVNSPRGDIRQASVEATKSSEVNHGDMSRMAEHNKDDGMNIDLTKEHIEPMLEENLDRLFFRSSTMTSGPQTARLLQSPTNLIGGPEGLEKPEQG